MKESSFSGNSNKLKPPCSKRFEKKNGKIFNFAMVFLLSFLIYESIDKSSNLKKKKSFIIYLCPFSPWRKSASRLEQSALLTSSETTTERSTELFLPPAILAAFLGRCRDWSSLIELTRPRFTSLPWPWISRSSSASLIVDGIFGHKIKSLKYSGIVFAKFTKLSFVENEVHKIMIFRVRWEVKILTSSFRGGSRRTKSRPSMFVPFLLPFLYFYFLCFQGWHIVNINHSKKMSALSI